MRLVLYSWEILRCLLTPAGKGAMSWSDSDRDGGGEEASRSSSGGGGGISSDNVTKPARSDQVRPDQTSTRESGVHVWVGLPSHRALHLWSPLVFEVLAALVADVCEWRGNDWLASDSHANRGVLPADRTADERAHLGVLTQKLTDQVGHWALRARPPPTSRGCRQIPANRSTQHTTQSTIHSHVMMTIVRHRPFHRRRCVPQQMSHLGAARGTSVWPPKSGSSGACPHGSRSSPPWPI